MWYKIQKIYVGTTKVRPTYRTFTISWTEKSSMASWWTYSDNAAWLTAGSTAFDEFFWYSWVRLSNEGVETAEITQAQSWWAWKLDITQLWTLTSGNNVMIKFPVRWIKMTKSWSVVTLSITDWLGRESEWYQYYAHCLWTINNPWTPKDAFYLWAYKAYDNNNNGILFSWSWRWPTTNRSQAVFCENAKKSRWSWFNIIWFYQRMYVNALYMMKYWNPNGKSVIWNGYIWWGSTVNTWGTNSQTNATYGTTANSKTQMKLFWLEDWRGNVYEYTGGAYCNSGTLYLTALGDYSWATTWGISSGITMASDGNISAIAGNNIGMFLPTSKVTNTSYNTYYCWYTYTTGKSLFTTWWGYNTNAWANIFAMQAQITWADTRTGTRLMYI